jgi:hypothetical protein
MTGAVEEYGWLWSCCEEVEKGRRTMLSIVLDLLTEYGCDFFGFLVFICTYPRGTFFFAAFPIFSLDRQWASYSTLTHPQICFGILGRVG